MPDNDKLFKLWNNLTDSANGVTNFLDIPEYDVFKQAFQEPIKRQKLYDNLKAIEPNINLTLPEYDQFELIGLNKLDDSPMGIIDTVKAHVTGVAGMIYKKGQDVLGSLTELLGVGPAEMVNQSIGLIEGERSPFLSAKVNEIKKVALENPGFSDMMGAGISKHPIYTEKPQLNEKQQIERDNLRNIELTQVKKNLQEDYAEMHNSKRRTEKWFIDRGLLTEEYANSEAGGLFFSWGMNMPFLLAGGLAGAAGKTALATGIKAIAYPMFTIMEANSIQGDIAGLTGQKDKDGYVIPGTIDLDKVQVAAIPTLFSGMTEFVGFQNAVDIFTKGIAAKIGWKTALRDVSKVVGIESLEEGGQNSIAQLTKMGVGVQDDFSFKEMFTDMKMGGIGGLGMGMPGTVYNQLHIQQLRKDIVKKVPETVKQLEEKKLITPVQAENMNKFVEIVGDPNKTDKEVFDGIKNIQEHFVEASKENKTRIEKIQAFTEYNDDIAKRGNELFKQRVSLMTPQPGEDYQVVIQKGFESEDLANKFIEKLAENPAFQEFKAKVAPQLQGMEPEQINGEIYRSILNIPSKKFEAPETLRNLFWNGYRLVLRDELDAKERTKPNQAEDIRETAFPVDDDVLFQFEKNDRRPSRTGPVSGLTGVNWDEVSYQIGTTNRINIRGKKSTPRWYWYFEKMDDASRFMTEKNTDWNAPVLKWSKQNQRVETDFNVTAAVARGTYNQETIQFQKEGPVSEISFVQNSEMGDHYIIKGVDKKFWTKKEAQKYIDEQVQPVVNEISSNSKGLTGALTNPTELAKSKGNIVQSYPVEFEGVTYPDAEAAYQANKSKYVAEGTDKGSTYDLMVKIITTKLQQYPKLTKAINELGGSDWILSATHQPTNKNTVWETGGQNLFIQALNDAYVEQAFQSGQTTIPAEKVSPAKPTVAKTAIQGAVTVPQLGTELKKAGIIDNDIEPFGSWILNHPWNQDIKVQWVTSDYVISGTNTMEGARGAYFAGTVYLNKNMLLDKNMYDTAAHESMHPFLNQALKNNTQFRIEMEEIYKEVQLRLNTDLIEEYKRNEKDFKEALKNLPEFLTYVMTNTSQIHQWAKRTPLSNKGGSTILQRVYSVVKRLLMRLAKRDANFSQQMPTFYDAIETLLSKWYGAPSTIDYWDILTDELNDNVKVDSAESQAEMFNSNAQAEDLRAARSLAQLLQSKPKYVESARMDPIAFIQSLSFKEFSRALRDEPDFITYITAKKGTLLPSMKFDEYVKRNLKQIYEIAKSQEMNPVIYINMVDPENPTVEEMGDYYTGRGHTNASSWKPKILMKQIIPELNKLFGNEFTMMFVDGVKLKGDRAIGLNDKLVLFEQGEKTEPPRNQFYADVLQKNGYIFLGTFADKQTGIALKPKNKIDPNTIIQLRKMYDERIVNMLNKLQNNAKAMADIGDPNTYRGKIDNIQEDMKSGYLFQRLMRLVSEDIKLGAKVLGPGQLQSVMYNADDSNTYDAKKLLKRPTLISQMRYTIQDEETVKDILTKTKGYGISQKNGELFGRTYIFKADPKPGEWMSEVTFHGKKLTIDFHYALVNDLGTETTDGILYVLENGGDYAYKQLHGVLKGGSKKMWVGNQHGEDPMFFKGSMQIISEDSILGHWMRQNKVTFLVSSTTAKYAMGSIQQGTLQALQAGNETGIFDMPFKNINRIYEKDSENEAVKGLQQSLNANMNVPGNKYFVDMGIDEFTDDVIGFLVKDYEKSVRMMDTAAIIKRMRDRALNGVSVPERTIAQVFLDLTYNTAARQANEATDDRELKYKRMVTRRMSDEKLAQTLGKVMLHPAFSRPVKGWLRDELSKVYSFKTSLEWQTLRPDIGWLDDAVLESLWNQLEGTEEEKWKLFEERIDMKSGRLKQGWAYMSESAQRLGLKINDKDIISIVPSTSLYSQYAIKIAGFIPKGVAELDSVVMNSEDIQSRGGRDFDIDQLLNFFLNEDRVSPSAYNKYWEMIKATSEKHQKEMLKDYKRILKNEKIQLKGGNYLDIRNMTEKDMFDPAVQIALVRKLTGTERPANNIVNPLHELFNINDKFLSPVSEAVSPRKKMTLLASIGAKSAVSYFELNANNEELSDTYLLFERLTNDFVDTPNNTNSFFYDVGPYRTTDKIWGIKKSRWDNKDYSLQTLSEDEPYGKGIAKEINRGINMAVDFLFAHAININSDSINVDDPNTSRGLPEDIYYIRMQQRIMELLNDGNKTELIRMFREYVGERLVLDKKKPQNYRMLEYGEEFIDNFEFTDLNKSAELKAVGSIDLTILPNAILTREKYIDWETRVLRNMMADSPYAKLAEEIFKTAPEVKRFASKPNQYLMTAYMLTAHNRKVHNIKNSLISIMLPVDQRQRDITEMAEGTYYDNTFNITNFDVFPALLSKVLKRRSIRFKDTAPNKQVLDFPSGAQIELTRGVNDVLAIRATNAKGVTGKWDNGYDFLMDDTNLGNNAKKALGINTDKEGNPILPAPAKMFGQETIKKLEDKLEEILKHKPKPVGERVVPKSVDEIKKLAYDLIEENIPNTSAERKLDGMHRLIRVIKESSETEGTKARSKAMYKINEMFSFGRNINVEDRLNLAEQYLNKVLPLMTEEEKDLMFMSLLGHPDQSDKNLPKTGLVSPLNLVNSERKKRMDNEYDYTTQQHFVELLARTGQKTFLNKYFTYLEKYYPGLGFADRIQILNDIESNDDILSGEKVWYNKEFEKDIQNESITKPRLALDVVKAMLMMPRRMDKQMYLFPNILNGKAVKYRAREIFRYVAPDATDFTGAINPIMIAYAKAKHLTKHINAIKAKYTPIRTTVNNIIDDIKAESRRDGKEMNEGEIWRDINLLRDKGMFRDVKVKSVQGNWVFTYDGENYTDIDELASDYGLENKYNRMRFKAVMELAKVYDYTNPETATNMAEYIKHVFNEVPEDFSYSEEVSALYNKWSKLAIQMAGRAGRYFPRTFKPEVHNQIAKRYAAYELLKSRDPKASDAELYKKARQWESEPEEFKQKVEDRSSNYIVDASQGIVYSWMKKRVIPDDLINEGEFIADTGSMHEYHQEQLLRAVKSDVMKINWWMFEHDTRRAGIDDKMINMMHKWFANEIHDSVFNYQKINYGEAKVGDLVAFYYLNRKNKEIRYRGIVKEVGKDFVKLEINEAIYEVKMKADLSYYKSVYNSIAKNAFLNGTKPATSGQIQYLKGLSEAGYIEEYDEKKVTKADAARMIYEGLVKQLDDKANWGKFEKRRIHIKQYAGDTVVKKVGFERSPYNSKLARAGIIGNQLMTASFLFGPAAGFRNATDALYRIIQAHGFMRFLGFNHLMYLGSEAIKENLPGMTKYLDALNKLTGIDKRYQNDDRWILNEARLATQKFKTAMQRGSFEEYDLMYRKGLKKTMPKQDIQGRINTGTAIAVRYILERGYAEKRVGGSSDYIEEGGLTGLAAKASSGALSWFEKREGEVRRFAAFLGAIRAVVIENQTNIERIYDIIDKYVARANSEYEQFNRKFGDIGPLGKFLFKFSQFNSDQLNKFLLQVEVGKQQGQIEGVFDKLSEGQLLEAAKSLGFNIQQIFRRDGAFVAPAKYNEEGIPDPSFGNVTIAKAGSSVDPLIARRIMKEAFQDTVSATILMPMRGLRSGNPVTRVGTMLLVFASNLIAHGDWPNDWDLSEWISGILGLFFGLGIQIPIQLLVNIAQSRENPYTIGNPRIFSTAAEVYNMTFGSDDAVTVTQKEKNAWYWTGKISKLTVGFDPTPHHRSYYNDALNELTSSGFFSVGTQIADPTTYIPIYNLMEFYEK